MPYVRPHKDGFRAEVEVKGVRKSRSGFRTRRAAEIWGIKQEEEIARGGASGMTFGEAARRWLDLHLTKLSNAGHKRNVEQSLRDYVLPALDARPLREIKRRELVAIVQAVSASSKLETAGRVAQRIRAVFDHAVDLGEIETHPANGLSRVIAAKQVTHMAAVSPSEAGDLLRAIASYPEPVTRLGLLLLAHTFVRTNELVGARWGELVEGGKVWVVPPERVKKTKGLSNRLPHVVPLSTQAQALLDELRTYTGESEFLLQSPAVANSSISSNTMLFALYRLGYKGRMTGHGFRALASTVLNESGKWSRDAIERQLQHQETDQVRAAYHRAEHLEERQKMMQWWSEWLSAAQQSTNTGCRCA
jgi:integrase